MPLQRPQFFEADLSDGEIQKSAVDKTIMPIQAHPPHFVVIVARVWPELAVIFRRPILGPTRHAYRGTIQEQGDIIRPFDIAGPPKILRHAPAFDARFRRIQNPLIQPKAAGRRVQLPGAVAPPAAFSVEAGRHGAEAYFRIRVVRLHLVMPYRNPFGEIAVVVLAVHRPDETPLTQVCLADGGLGVLLNTLQGRHEDRHQQGNNRDHHQELD